ncbi:MAG: hypothetical protein ACK4EX_02495 [Thermaurantimonas sp.]|uniref:Uncharacterized protein n=1 Tax=Thermaurantimonas aggregans TaxID=2173829 RepID=A0A401XI12_9FLAO|nr:hypothetical protein [Thermaurantimonas aggregans]MCX8149205.1 hypothetical protein [Thermaurantimonas aggregans]GCD76647.1 hypothetical protein JCM31826_01290 [Thermaurantimonas aggregans]
MNLNIIRTAHLLIPPFLRKKRFKAFITVSVSYLNYLCESQKLYRFQINTLLQVTPQVIYIERYLKQFFNDQIRLQEGYYLGPFLNTESAIYLNPLNEVAHIYYSGEAKIDFVVQIPVSLQTQKQQIMRLINFFKLPGKKYKIDLI